MADTVDTLQCLREMFRLSVVFSSETLTLRAPSGTARMIRIGLVLVAVGLMTLAGLYTLGGSATEALMAVGTALIVLAWYEPYQLTVTIQDGCLITSMSPCWNKWLGSHTVDITAVTEVSAWSAFIILKRGDDREILFVPLPHLRTASREGANETAAKFIREHLRAAPGAIFE